MSINSHEWIDRNSLRAYPFLSTRNNTTRLIPDSLVADMTVFWAKDPGSYPHPVVRLTHVHYSKMMVTLFFGDQDGNSLFHATMQAGKPGPVRSSKILSHLPIEGTVVFGTMMASLSSYRYRELSTEGMLELPSSGEGVLEVLPSRIHLIGEPPVKRILTGFKGGPSAGKKTFDTWEGDLTISLDTGLAATFVDDGQVTTVTIDCADPWNFLPDCIPENDSASCWCEKTPIRKINGVARNEATEPKGVEIILSGTYGELEVAGIETDQNRSFVSISLALSSKQTCSPGPILPDVYGRLGPNYKEDCPPDFPYMGGRGPDCENPPDKIGECYDEDEPAPPPFEDCPT